MANCWRGNGLMKAERNTEVGRRHSGATLRGLVCAGGAVSEEWGGLLEGKF